MLNEAATRDIGPGRMGGPYGLVWLIGGVQFPDATRGPAIWHAKVLTVLPELDVATTATCADGQAGGHHQVDGRAYGEQRRLAAQRRYLAR